ncbi:sulfite exporter TauE/SafE family protein [Alishewanella sp. HL-SH05]|uniref:sulfite exporter TauE/SafE family protein n=1 Tax=Alishewanella sp. HL-SH05 TaxID=3461145 RepID=UPI004042E4C4
MAIEWILAFVSLGVFAGFMAGLLGIGGGGIMVPMLTSIFVAQGISPDYVVHLALGTSMTSIMMTSLSSLRVHHAKGGVLWPIVKVMAPWLIIGSFAATFIAARISGYALAVFFAIFMSYIGIKMLRPKKAIVAESRNPRKLELAAVGTGVGAISALVSIGGGTLTVPYLSWRNITLKYAIGTSAAIGLPISLAGASGYLLNAQPQLDLPYTVGLVYLPGVVLISAASFFTARIGAKLAHKLPVNTLRKIFAILLILLSLKMLWYVL